MTCLEVLRATHQDVRLDDAAQGGEGEERRRKDSLEVHAGGALKEGGGNKQRRAKEVCATTEALRRLRLSMRTTRSST